MKPKRSAVAWLRRASVLFVTLLAGVVGATDGRFRYERPLIPAGPGPNRVTFDAALLSGAAPLLYAGGSADAAGGFAGGLGDLRLFDAGGHEVPYLLVASPQPAPKWQSGTMLPIAATDEASGFEVDLGSIALVNQLRLDGISAPFMKRVRLEGGGDRARWTLLLADATLFDLPEEGLARTALSFAAGEYRYFRVTWDDRKSAVVPPPRAVAARRAFSAVAEPVLEEPLDFERRPSEPGTSRFRIRLPGPRLPITALTLSCGGGHLLRRAEVREPRCAGDDVVRQVLGARVIRRVARGELTAADLRIPISRPTGAELELAVDDGDNPPLELTGVTAELAPLPWLYFESAAGETLTARFGDPQLSAPRYDLEAARASVDVTRVPLGRWGERRPLAPAEETAADGEPLPDLGGPIDTAGFRFARDVHKGPSGFTALRLDVAVLAHSPNLSDLRIAVAKRQVPYLLERLDEPLVLPLPPLRAQPSATPAARPGLSRYELALPYETLPAARLVLKTTARVFERRLSLTVEHPAADMRATPRAERVVEMMWRHTNPENAPPPLVLSLPPLRARLATLVIDEGDNSPLPLDEPQLLLPAYRLRFFRPASGDLRLLYGRTDLGEPRYDLALLAPRLVRAATAEATMGAESEQQAVPDERAAERSRHRTVFWAALVVAALVLLVLIARLLGSGNDSRKKD